MAHSIFVWGVTPELHDGAELRAKGQDMDGPFMWRLLGPVWRGESTMADALKEAGVSHKATTKLWKVWIAQSQTVSRTMPCISKIFGFPTCFYLHSFGRVWLRAATSVRLFVFGGFQVFASVYVTRLRFEYSESNYVQAGKVKKLRTFGYVILSAGIDVVDNGLIGTLVILSPEVLYDAGSPGTEKITVFAAWSPCNSLGAALPITGAIPSLSMPGLLNSLIQSIISPVVVYHQSSVQ